MSYDFSRARSFNGKLPSWKDLTSIYEELSYKEAYFNSLLQLKERSPFDRSVRPLTVLLEKIILRRLKKTSYYDLIYGGWEELVDVFCEQVSKNIYLRKRISFLEEKDLLPADFDMRSAWNRPHNQFPCARFNVADRVQAISGFCEKNAPVLLLGDDDLLGPALARAGFQDITIIDIDPKVVKRVRHELSAIGVNSKVCVHDLSRTPSPDLVRDYALIVLDPPCTPEGLNLFMSGAIKMCTKTAKTKYFVCTHLMSQKRKGLEVFSKFLEQNALEVETFLPGFAVYPVPKQLQRILRAIIVTVNILVVHTSALYRRQCIPQFFVSDAFLLKPCSHN